MKNTIKKCPLCPKYFVHEKYMLSHLVRCHAHAVDLLAPWKIPKGRRGSNMIIPPHEPEIQEMVVFVAPRAMRLPMKKRMALIIHMAHQHQLFVCHMCGRSYTNVIALGDHKAQHALDYMDRIK